MAKVKRSFPLFGATLWIKVGRKYSAEELLELMRQNFGDKYGPLEIGGMIKRVELDGVKGYRIHVVPTVVGRQIMITHWEKMPEAAYTLGGCIFGFISGMLNILTLGIAHWQIWGFRKNRHIMIPLSEDIAKIVEG